MALTQFEGLHGKLAVSVRDEYVAINLPLGLSVNLSSHALNKASTHDINIHHITADERRALALGICPELANSHAALTARCGRLVGVVRAVEWSAFDGEHAQCPDCYRLRPHPYPGANKCHYIDVTENDHRHADACNLAAALEAANGNE